MHFLFETHSFFQQLKGKVQRLQTLLEKQQEKSNVYDVIKEGQF